MAPQQQVCPDTSVEFLRNFRLDCPLCFTITWYIVLGFASSEQSLDHVGGVKRNCSHGCAARKQKNAVSARIANTWEALECLASSESGSD